MKRLTDEDIEKMTATEFTPDTRDIRRAVREQLKLGQLIPHDDEAIADYAILDLHTKTEQESWDAIMALATSGVRTATIITGASGILKIKFQQWARDSVLSPYIQETHPINNGSFFVRFRRQKS